MNEMASEDVDKLANELDNVSNTDIGTSDQSDRIGYQDIYDMSKGEVVDGMSIGSGDTKAFNVDKLPAMEAAVDEYIASINGQIAVISDYQVGGHDGIYGPQAQTVDNYILAICDEMRGIVSYFDRFKAALQEVKAAYIAESEGYTAAEVTAGQAMSDSDLVNVNRMG